MLRRNADILALAVMVLAFFAARAWWAHQQARAAAQCPFDAPQVWMIQPPGGYFSCPDLSGVIDGLRR
jgi:hypothetical protein